MNLSNARRRPGLTLVELLVVLTILAVMTTLAVTMTDSFVDQGRYEATLQTLDAIQKAVLGDPNQIDAAGRRVMSGYIADTGTLPTSLDDLLVDPGLGSRKLVPIPHPTVPNVLIGSMLAGWRGPYVQLASSNASQLLDGWGQQFKVEGDAEAKQPFGRVYSDGGFSDPYKGPLYMRTPVVLSQYTGDVYGNIIDTNMATAPSASTKVQVYLYRAVGNGFEMLTPNDVGGVSPTFSNSFAFTFPKQHFPNKMTVGPKVLVAVSEDGTTSEVISFQLTPDGAMHNLRMELKDTQQQQQPQP
jgi:prepilin-type N-terminal cleavage/methylation domain-containing protein